MAEAIARHVIADHLGVSDEQLEGKGVIVLSAGSWAMPGAKATPQAVEAVKTIGADLSKHRSKPLTVELIHQADMIFAMGRSHLQAVTALVPAAAEKNRDAGSIRRRRRSDRRGCLALQRVGDHAQRIDRAATQTDRSDLNDWCTKELK
jgi:protein-tyrosine-phosphatase